MEVLHSQSARLRPLLPGHAHSAVPSPHAQAVFLATQPPCQSVDVGEEDTPRPPAARRGSAVVKELLNMGFREDIAERASKEAPGISAAVEEAIRLSSATTSRPSEMHSMGKAKPSTNLPSGSHIPPAILLLDREEHGSRSPATPSTPSRVASNVSSVVWQERRREVSVDESASEAELQQYRRHSSSSIGADAYAALEAERELLETTDDMISLHSSSSDYGVTKQPVAEMTRSVQPSSVPQAPEEMRSHASMQDGNHLRGEGDLHQAQLRLDQLRKRRESLLSDCSPGPKSPSSSSFSSQTLIEGTKPLTGQATPLRAPILLVRPQSRTPTVDPTNLGAHANGHGGSHEHSNGRPASPAATRRSFDSSIDSTPDYSTPHYPYGARVKSSHATGPTGLQQTSREGQEPLVAGVAAHYLDASPCRLNGKSPILSNANLVSGTSRPGHDHVQVTENQGLDPQRESPRGLGMRVKEKADGSVYINYMQKEGAAAAADPFLKVGDRVLSIGMALSNLPEFSRSAHIVTTHIQ
jgi:hypothetical protein